MPSSILSPSRLFRPRTRLGWIGVDFGSDTIKLAQLEMVGTARFIAQALVIPLPETAALTSASLRTGWLGQLLLDEMTRGFQFRGRIASCVLSMSSTEFRSLDLPPGTYQERREMISQEFASAGNPTAEPVEFDFWDGPGAVGDASNPGTSTVNVLSISQPVARQVAVELSRAGLICRVLDGGQFTLARAARLIHGDAPGQQPTAVLDWGHQSAHFVVIADGEPVFSRILKDCGMGGLVAAVSKGLDLSRVDCQELLSTCGFPDPARGAKGPTELQELARDLAAEPLTQLFSELKRTLLYLQHQRPELAPAVLTLLGGGAAIRNVGSMLVREIGMPVQLWKLPQSGGAAQLLHETTPVALFAQAAALSELGWER